MNTPNLNKALSIAQSQFKPVTFNAKAKVQMKAGGSYEFQYADLSHILDCTRDALSKNGLALAARVAGGELSMDLRHESGEMITSSLPIRVQDRPQELGSMLTYYRRYLICGLLGIAADEDDDANTAEGNGAEIEKKKPKQEAKAKEKPVVPGANLVNLKSAGEYVVKFGKSKGKTLTQMGAANVSGMIGFIKNKSDEKFRASEMAAEFLFFADQFLRQPGNGPDEDLDVALQGNSPAKDDIASPPDWASEPMPNWDDKP